MLAPGLNPPTMPQVVLGQTRTFAPALLRVLTYIVTLAARVNVGVGISVAVGTSVSVTVGVWVAVDVSVAVGVWVDVGESVAVDVGV